MAQQVGCRQPAQHGGFATPRVTQHHKTPASPQLLANRHRVAHRLHRARIRPFAPAGITQASGFAVLLEARQQLLILAIRQWRFKADAQGHIKLPQQQLLRGDISVVW